MSSAVAGRGRCTTYGSGHEVHWIQARKGAEDRERRKGKVREIDGDRIHLRLGGVERVFFSHSAGRLIVLLEKAGPGVRVQERWHLLWVHNYLFSVALSELEWVPCRPRTSRAPATSSEVDTS